MSQADWDRLQYYSRKVKVFNSKTAIYAVHPSSYIRITQLLQSSPLFPLLRSLESDMKYGDNIHIFLFLSPLLHSLTLDKIRGFENSVVGPFLATLSSSPQMLRRIVLRTGRLSVDIIKNSFVHFKQLRSLELSNAVFMTDFSLWEFLGTLPSLENLTLEAIDPASHPAHAPEHSNSQSVNGGLRYFDALKSLRVKGSLFLVQHLLGFIDSPCLKSIKVSPVINRVQNEVEPEDLFTHVMTIIASKWSQSLNSLDITGNSMRCIHPISKCLSLLGDLNLRSFRLRNLKMGNMDDDMRRLVMSWPKLRSLKLPHRVDQFISLSTLGIIAENCPDLRHLRIQLDTSTIPPFDSSRKSLRHNLMVLTVGEAHPSTTETQTPLECQIQVTRYLNLFFPYLKSIEVPHTDEIWSGIRDLVRLCQEVVN